MKKIIITAAIITIAITATAMQVLRNVTKNDRQVRKSQDLTLPIDDLRLRAYLLKKYDTDGDDLLSVTEAEAIRTIECSNMKIEQLPDLAHFPNLEILRCDKNKITHIGGGRNPHLIKIIADHNPLATIDLSGFPALRDLEVSGCYLDSVDLTYCPELERIDCSSNDLTDINLSGSPALRYIHLSGCDLKSIDLTPCPELEEIDVYDNYSLTDLDFSPCPKLIKVACNASVIVTMPQSCSDIAIRDTRVDLTLNTLQLDIGDTTSTLHIDDLHLLAYLLKEYDIDRDGRLSTTEAAAISVIECNEMSIGRLPDLTHFPNLQILHCNRNKITHIGGHNPHLVEIDASYNRMATIDLGGFPALRSLKVSHCKINSIDLTPCHALDTLDISDNRLTSLDLTPCPKLLDVRFGNNHITTIDLRMCARLTVLGCHNNGMTSLLLGDHPELENISCGGNYLMEINLRGSPALKWLFVNGNKFQSLDLSRNPALTYLHCSNNNLAYLDLSENPLLSDLICQYTDLRILNLKTNTALEHLYCSYNNRLKKIILPQVHTPKEIYKEKSARLIYK